MNKQTVMLMLVLVWLAHSHLQVYNYNSLDKSLQDQSLLNISYSVANFGFAPFGKTMISNLVESPGLSTQCQTTDEDYDSIICTITSNVENSFLLIPRGQCPFVTKAIHAQQLGAQVAIIMDNQKHDRGVIMKDDGFGYKVKIPAIFIHFEDGQKLVKLLSLTNNKVMLKITFQSVKTDKVNVVFYLEAFNRQSYSLVKGFRQYQQKIKDYINFTVVHNVFHCGPQKCSSDDCYGDGQYCAVHYPHEKSANGKAILDQQIKQDIVFQEYLSQWWNYMNCVDVECVLVSQIQGCNSACMKKNSIDESVVNAKFNDSFFYRREENSILKKDASLIKYSGIDTFPGVALNNVKIKGSLAAEFIFDDICNTLSNPPKQCKDQVKQIFQNYQSIDWVLIGLVLVLGTTLFSLLFCMYRRHMRKKMAGEMQGRVDDMVSKYIQFYSERGNR